MCCPPPQSGIYGISWCSDSKRILTCSADKTAKIWEVEGNALLTTFTFPTEGIDYQMVGCLWQVCYTGCYIDVSSIAYGSFRLLGVPSARWKAARFPERSS